MCEPRRSRRRFRQRRGYSISQLLQDGMLELMRHISSCLLPEQLAKFGITTAASAAQAAAASSKWRETLQAGFDSSDLVRERLKTRMSTLATAAHSRRDAAKKATQNLSGIPAHLRGADNPLQNNKLLIADRASLKQLPDIQKNALTQGLSRRKEQEVHRQDLPHARRDQTTET